MRVVAINDTATLVASAGNRDFLHIYNASDTTIYVAYDGETAPTVAGGIPIEPTQTLQLNNDGSKPIFTKAVYAIHASSGQQKNVRLQGD